MAIFLSDTDVARLLTMDDALDAVEEGFRLQASGGATNTPRTHAPLPNGEFSVMSAAIPARGVMGVKTFGLIGESLVSFYLYLYDAENGALLAVVEANEKGRIRTGAASGVATKYLASEGASMLGIIGAGYQAWTQLQAITHVRPLREVRVFCRTPSRMEALADRARRELGLDAIATGTAEECVRGADIVVTVTTSQEPVLKGEWLAEGAHVNAVGSHHLDRAELDAEAVRRAAVVVTDDGAQARLECGDLAAAIEAGAFGWERAVDLAAVVAGQTLGRVSDSDVTLFESQGIALEDVAVGARLYEIAVAEGAGRELPL